MDERALRQAALEQVCSDIESELDSDNPREEIDLEAVRALIRLGRQSAPQQAALDKYEPCLSVGRCRWSEIPTQPDVVRDALLKQVRTACQYAYTICRKLDHEEEIGRNALHTITQMCGKAVGAIDTAIQQSAERGGKP